MNLTKQLNFKYPWRSYQQRILDELDAKLEDDRLHIVSAPGSGKTMLGLEVFRRLGTPCLVLAPTLTIRNQWIQRLQEAFLPADFDVKPHVSTWIERPAQFTCITYQALHTAFTGDEAEQEEPNLHHAKWESILERFLAHEIDTLILDEAHYLRKEWWRSLKALVAGLDEPRLVSLTATPPYDVSNAEWKRYKALCGPIDAEISVPELVKKGDLCPHQDYIHLSLPSKEDALLLADFKQAVQKYINQLAQNREFIQFLSGHPWIASPQDHLEEILAKPRFFTSFLVFLHAIGETVPENLLEVLGVTNESIPPLDTWWLEIFLQEVLYNQSHHFRETEEIIAEMKKKFSGLGVIHRNRIELRDGIKIRKTLSQSTAKLKSIETITRFEAKSLGTKLRMVILTDYVKAGVLPDKHGAIGEMNQLGVVPIFEQLRRAALKEIRLAVLTGSLLILPRDILDAFQNEARQLGIPKDQFAFLPLQHDPEYVRVVLKQDAKLKRVPLITRIFNAGDIHVIIGTQALLGVGWDAPSINTMILASYVGSFMLSNQMRGRAIRIDPDQPQKVANIWHLATVDLHPLDSFLPNIRDITFKPLHDPESDSIYPANLGSDFHKLIRRFSVFEGVSERPPYRIHNGIRRLKLPTTSWTPSEVNALNHRMLERAASRNQLPAIWQEALQGSSEWPRLRQRIESNHAPTGLMLYDTLKYLAISGVQLGSALFMHILRLYDPNYDALKFGIIALGISMVISVPRLAKSAYLWVRNGSLENSLYQVGRALIESLEQANLLGTDPKKLFVIAEKDPEGVVFCRLEGGNTKDTRLFYESLKEVLSPIHNPRHLLITHSSLGPFKRTDYHAVPSMLAASKKKAAHFKESWNRHVGKVTLVDTRQLEGRKILLKARMHSYAAAFQKKTEQLSVWE